MPNNPLYVKTPKGVEEVHQRKHGLSQRIRQLLVLVNGKRKLSDFSVMFPAEDLNTTFGSLLTEGFVEEVKSPTPSASPTALDDAPVPENEDERFKLAHNFMINSVAALLGVMGAGLIEKLERCENLEELRGLYGKWREAIHTSAEGRKQAPDLERRLSALLS